MGSLKKGNFIKEFIMSFLWSVDKPEKSRKREISPDNRDSEPEIEKKTPKVTPKFEKKCLKRPIESENSDKSEDEVKRTKCSSIRNEISSSLSSSAQKKRTANFDSDDDSDEVDLAPKKVLKSESQGKSKDEPTDEKSVDFTPVVQKTSTKLKFSKQLSPKKILKNISIDKESESQESNSFVNLEENKLLVKKDIITDAKALLADQEKSEERGKKLLEAFDD